MYGFCFLITVRYEEKGLVYPNYICNNRTDMKIIGLPGTSFSPSRALGVDVLKRSISKMTGVPMTKSGLERKIGRTIIKSVTKHMK